MAYRYGDDRHQILLFPDRLDSYVSADHPVRAYDAFVDHLNFKDLGIDENDNQVGNPEYHPRLMLKLLLYSYSYGVKSSRKIEREIHNNVTFIWLLKNLKPDHKTIAEFRRQNKKALQKSLVLCARLCMKLGLIDGNILFLDGTKIRANAGRSNNHTQKWYQDQLKNLEEKIASLLLDCEKIDDEEKDQGSLVKMEKELKSAQVLESKIKEALQEFQRYDGPTTNEGVPRTVNSTDPECALMHGVQGSHASYNVQNVVDEKHGLIVYTDSVHDASDVNQFSTQIENAQATLGHRPEVACADAGYADTQELLKIQSKGTAVIVPSKKQAAHGDPKPFDKEAFIYDEKEDSYLCPEGHSLYYDSVDPKRKKMFYRMKNPGTCLECKHFGVCTQSDRGRKITRLFYEKDRIALEKQYEDPVSQEIYKKRKAKVEHPFGHIKRNLGLTHFLMRGKDGTRAEAAIGSVCFNVTRMVTLLGGVQTFMKALPGT